MCNKVRPKKIAYGSPTPPDCWIEDCEATLVKSIKEMKK